MDGLLGLSSRPCVPKPAEFARKASSSSVTTRARFNSTVPSWCPPEAARSGGSPAGGTTPSTWPPSPSAGSATARGAAPTTARLAKARLRGKRCALKRRISDALSATMVTRRLPRGARTAASSQKAGSGGQPGNDSVASAAGSHPDTPALRPSHSRARPKATTTKTRSRHATPRPRADRTITPGYSPNQTVPQCGVLRKLPCVGRSQEPRVGFWSRRSTIPTGMRCLVIRQLNVQRNWNATIVEGR
jgi:hypothetical protein